MHKCILRVEKLKTFGEIASSVQHTLRERPTPNADPARAFLNRSAGPTTSKGLVAEVVQLLPIARRKDAVLCLEYFVSATPEWFEGKDITKINAYFIDAARWIGMRHGKDNVVGVYSHFDETTPHLVLYVVPLTEDGRLSAKHFCGSGGKLSQMQTKFAEDVGKKHGLERGIEGSTARHITNKQYNAALLKNPTLAPPAPPSPSLGDHLTGKAKKSWVKYAEDCTAYWRLVTQNVNVALLGHRAAKRRDDEHQAMHDENRRLRARIEAAERSRNALEGEKALLLEQISTLKARIETLLENMKKVLAENVSLRALAERFGSRSPHSKS